MMRTLKLLAATPLLCYLALMSPVAQAQSPAPPSNPVSIPDAAEPIVEKERALRRKIRAWEWVLTQISRRENTTIFMDTPLDLTPPNIAYDKPYGVNTMRALANGSDREWKQTAGIQTFTRRTMRTGHQQVTEALKWLAALPQNDFQRLLAGQVRLSDLDPQTQGLMYELAGWEPDMNFALLGKSDATQVRLVVGAKFRYIDPKSGETKGISVPISPQKAVLPARPIANRAPDIKPLDKPVGGVLTFGAGEILTLADIVKRAADRFHNAYVVDGRIQENRYFVSGSYNKEDFEAVLSQVTTIPPVRPKPGRPDRTSDLALLRSRVLELDPGKINVNVLRGGIRINNSEELAHFQEKYGANEELTASDFLQNRSVKASDLSEGRPGFSLFLKQLGIGPDTVLALDADFGLAFQGEGTHILSHGSSSVDGQAGQTLAPNEVMIGLQ